MHIIEGDRVDRTVDWPRVIAALRQGHRQPKPQLDDMLLQLAPNAMLVRAAWIEGLGACVKAMTVFPSNVERTPYVPSIQGQVTIFDRDTGAVLAAIDGAAVTRWKTAGDSALGADLLARPDCRRLLMVGAGTMAEPLVRAHLCVRPSLSEIALWNRSAGKAEELAGRLADLGRPVTVASDLEAAVRQADLVSVATMTKEPIIQGAWLRPGTHLDLIGAYRLDMREADDEAIRRAKVFVDYRATTIGHIGEVTTPIRTGVISEKDILGDLYDLVPGAPGRRSADDITLFKNGGGAHLDLMTSLAILAGAAAAGA